ncbi:MAG: hypothetical protein H5U40_19035 [Polyangiaceae bacterium]|nr:hypothetical protein [Polyangiaceae bacterium]
MSDASAPNETIAKPLRAILDLFEETLADVRFPDVSSELLREKALAVHERAEAVMAARESLAAAEAGLAEERASLAELGGKALAYARIYAAGRPDLLERLEAIDLGGGEATARKRGRPRKQRDREDLENEGSPSPALPFDDDAFAAH